MAEPKTAQSILPPVDDFSYVGPNSSLVRPYPWPLKLFLDFMRKKQENVVTLPHPMESSALISSGFRGGRGSGSGHGSVRGDRGGGR
ncbi:hypothetical protein IFM89_038802 [Coptis chinensis]|uniref:Uncharacterized protein n=1 Tax=Coptis chinensis TaxID=261450 RepID=A0A835HH03_9MAGN|nr:hypothetical protein IFM89_038802 [Coptis chinensis]